MHNHDLGLFKDYGHIIIPLCIMFYMGTYIFLARDYGYIDDEDYYDSRD
jgi:hypothetical protein